MRIVNVLLIFLPLTLFSSSLEENPLFRDLEIVQKVDKKLSIELPILKNFILQGGYFSMPSARMEKSGNVGLGFAYAPPYHIYSAGIQFFNHVEITGNYRVFKGVSDPTFGQQGFGDFADRIPNIKFSFLKKSDGFPLMPEMAFGFNDFIGSRDFFSYYFVLTKQFIDWGIEATLGWGDGRINGFFGALAWTPFQKLENLFLSGITLAAEYDANDYHRNAEHPSGRQVTSHINAGVHYQIFDLFQASVGSLRGRKLAATASLHYNLGETEGFFPKVYDPLPYTAPVNVHPLGSLRTQREFAQELAYAFQEQGLDLYQVILTTNQAHAEGLWIKIINDQYRTEEVFRERIEHVLASLIPSNIEFVTVVLEAEGVNVQQYQYNTKNLERFQKKKSGSYELSVVSPMENVTEMPSLYDGTVLFKRNKRIWTFTFRPRFQSYFGSTQGKFKYDAGFLVNQEGYFYDKIYYNTQASYTIKASTENMSDFDQLNPSQLLNVRSDEIRYYQNNSFHVDKAYLQSSFNLYPGWFLRLAGGYFEIAYLGGAIETLYYPANSSWAIGLQYATVFKRGYNGLGTQEKIRKLNGTMPTHVPYVGIQYFLDFYYDWKRFGLDLKFSLGQFLAKDKGLKIEVGKTFDSGFRVGFWYTVTTAKDFVNGERYFDKGFAFSLPLDIFLNKSSRSRVGYAMAIWLRDVGAKAQTGKELYPTIYSERYKVYDRYY